MDNRLRNLIIGVLIILIIVLIWVFFFRSSEEVVDVPEPNVAQVDQPDVTFVQVVPVVTPPAPVRQDNVERLTTFFVERYGSYSNQSPYSNLDGLSSVATDEFSRILTAMQQGVKTIPDTYVGISTRVLSVKVIDESESDATVIASTQRVESRESKENSTRFFQDMELVLKKINGNWSVDSATWL